MPVHWGKALPRKLWQHSRAPVQSTLLSKPARRDEGRAFGSDAATAAANNVVNLLTQSARDTQQPSQ
eukprot:3140017-Pyramimonas_sp.AAC.1